MSGYNEGRPVTAGRKDSETMSTGQPQPMNPVYKAAWVAALRDPAWKQGRNRLATVGDNGADLVREAAGRRDAAAGAVIRDNAAFCCKGVLCEVAISMGAGLQRHFRDKDDDEDVFRIAYYPPESRPDMSSAMNLPGYVVVAAGLTTRVWAEGESVATWYTDDDINPESEYQIAWQRQDGTWSTLDIANDGRSYQGRPPSGALTFAEIARNIEEQF